MSRLDAEIEILQTSGNGRDHGFSGPNFTGPDFTGRARRFDPASAGFDGTARTRQRSSFGSASTKGFSTMGIFSRTRDIIAANFNDMLDKAEDPAKMIRLIILEMEETLVEVRTSSARTIADQKELRRHVGKLDKLQADWGEKAQLALSKNREDLARAALLERKKAVDMGEQLNAEIVVLDDALRAYEEDIEKLQSRLREARSRQSSIAARLQSAENRVKLRTLLSNERVDEALVRFEQLERRVDYAEGRAEAMNLADKRQPTLAEEIAALADGDTIEAELAEMKRAMGSNAPAAASATKTPEGDQF